MAKKEILQLGRTDDVNSAGFLEPDQSRLRESTSLWEIPTVHVNTLTGVNNFPSIADKMDIYEIGLYDGQRGCTAMEHEIIKAFYHHIITNISETPTLP